MFIKLKEQVENQFKELEAHKLYRVFLPKNTLFDTYLNALPENEKQFHNCNCCKSFLNNYGNVVAIVNNKLVTLWDFKTTGIYKNVPKALKELVQNSIITEPFITKETSLGTDYNYSEKTDIVTKWEHFHHTHPTHLVHIGTESVKTIQGYTRDSFKLLSNGLENITLESCNTVIELINQNSLYRGHEFLTPVLIFKELLEKYLNTSNTYLFSWDNVYSNVARIKNTVIGSLLLDISNDIDLDIAVAKFEAKVAPTNYKRPKAIVTGAQIKTALNTLKELNLENSLYRQHTSFNRLPNNNMLFTDKTVKTNFIENLLKDSIDENPKTFKSCVNVNIDDFINKVLPTAKNIEVLFESKHEQNLVTLTEPKYTDSENLFTWDNSIAWSYKGNISDSLKKYVKKAGGNTEAILRTSLVWNENGNNNVDLDLHCIEPDVSHIYYSNKGKQFASSGMLDVDVTHPNGKIAVENITWVNKNKMQEGTYTVFVINYENYTTPEGFKAEIMFENVSYTFNYTLPLKPKDNVEIAKFTYTHKNGLVFLSRLPFAETVKTIWNLKTASFHKVTNICLSPNYWDNSKCVNKHYMFLIDTCKTDEEPRGFFNEYIKPSLLKHKRIFEVLGSKIKVPVSTTEVSGLGFSSTQQNHIYCKVTSDFTRIIKIIF